MCLCVTCKNMCDDIEDLSYPMSQEDISYCAKDLTVIYAIYWKWFNRSYQELKTKMSMQSMGYFAIDVFFA